MSANAKIVDYYFSVISPWSYLGDKRLRALAHQHGYQVRHHPMLSPVVFPATGGLPLKDRAKPRQDYRLQELERWSQHLGVTIHLKPKFFPAPEAPASKMILAAQDSGEDVGPFVHAILRGVWEEQKDIADDATLRVIAESVGLDGQALLARAKDASYDEKLQAEAQAAIARGVFGYPTYALNEQLFWGQDRLDFVERAMQDGL